MVQCTPTIVPESIRRIGLNYWKMWVGNVTEIGICQVADNLAIRQSNRFSKLRWEVRLCSFKLYFNFRFTPVIFCSSYLLKWLKKRIRVRFSLDLGSVFGFRKKPSFGSVFGKPHISNYFTWRNSDDTLRYRSVKVLKLRHMLASLIRPSVIYKIFFWREHRIFFFFFPFFQD